MNSALMVVLILVVTTLIRFFGFTEIVAPIAKAAILLVPAIFTISLAIGFTSRRLRWFR